MVCEKLEHLHLGDESASEITDTTWNEVLPCYEFVMSKASHDEYRKAFRDVGGSSRGAELYNLLALFRASGGLHGT